MSNSRFDDIFSAASELNVEDEPTAKTKPTKPPTKKSQAKPNAKAQEFWSDFEHKEDRIRLNVDISNALNDRLSAKAKKLGQPKTELVRRLIEWALNEKDE
jgi:hypothetical protein